MKHKWKRLLSVALTLALLSTLLVPMAGATEKRAAQSRLQRLELTPVDADGLGLLQGSVLPEDEAREAEPYRLTDTVRVSIVLERTSTIGAGVLMEDIAANTAARLYSPSSSSITSVCSIQFFLHVLAFSSISGISSFGTRPVRSAWYFAISRTTDEERKVYFSLAVRNMVSRSGLIFLLIRFI